MKSLQAFTRLFALLCVGGFIAGPAPLRGQVIQPDLVFTNHTLQPNVFRSLVFSRDSSNLLACLHYSPTFYLWRTKGLIPVFGGGSARYRYISADFSFGSKMVAIGSSGGSASVGGIPPYGGGGGLSIDDDRMGQGVAFQPVDYGSSAYVVNAGPWGIQSRAFYYFTSSGSSGSYNLVDFPNSFQNGDVAAMTFAPDGQTFLLGTQISYTDSRLQQWRFADQTKLFELTYTNSSIQAINYLNDGREVLTLITNGNNAVRLRRFNGPFVEHVFPEPHTIASVSLSPDGKLLAIVGADNFLRFWRVDTGQPLLTFAQEPGGVTAVAFSPDGKHFAYGRGDGLLVLARIPLIIEEFSLSGGRVTLRWFGGSGLYQVQRRKDQDKGKWHDVGKPTTATTFSEKIPGKDKFQFYRVQSLPNP